MASLAGVTVSWLAKLEQGQANAVSPDVLDALGRALHLDETERAHLYALAGYRIEGGASPDGEVTRALRALLDSLEPNPAYLLDRAWNIVAWNSAEVRLFPRLASIDESSRNLLELVFCDDDLRGLMVDSDDEQVRLVAQFRAHHTDWPGDPRVEDVITRLRDASDRFAALWDAKDVSPFFTTLRVFDHPVDGRLEFEHHRLAVLDQPGMQLVVYTPVASRP